MTLFSRSTALSNLSELGLFFTREKREAILRGDMSNLIVHPHFVYGLQATGGYICRTSNATPAMARSQAMCDQMAWESLAELNETGHHRVKAQALILIAHKCFRLGFTQSAKLYILKLCETVENAKLRFLPDDRRPGELSEQIREDVSVLSQAMYLENYIFLVLGGSAAVMTERIEREFIRNLQVRTFHDFSFSFSKSIVISCPGNVPASLQDVPIDYANPRYTISPGCGPYFE